MAKVTAGLTDEQLEDLLTDEERAGMLDEDLIDDPTPIIAEEEQVDDAAAEAAPEPKEAEEEEEGEDEKLAEPDPNAPKTEETKSDDAGAGEQQDEAAKAAAAAAAATEADQQPAGADDGIPDPVMPAPPLRYELPKGTNERLAEIDQQMRDIQKKADDGEINYADMYAQLRPLQREDLELQNRVIRAQTSAEEQATYQREVFLGHDVPKFLKANPVFAQGSLMTMLDQKVHEMQQAHPDRIFDPKILEEASSSIIADFAKAGIVIPAPKAPATGKTAPATGKRPPPPPSLAHVPAAALTETGDVSKFAYLDRLKGEAYEDALEKLSDADRDLYLSQG